MIGFAADGFPIFGSYIADGDTIRLATTSYQLRSGTREGGPGGEYDGTFVDDWEYVAGSGDLDECNGRTGVTPDYPDGTYYYVITESFPSIPRCIVGTPSSDFRIGF